jgi:hypothetical protein
MNICLGSHVCNHSESVLWGVLDLVDCRPERRPGFVVLSLQSPARQPWQRWVFFETMCPHIARLILCSEDIASRQSPFVECSPTICCFLQRGPDKQRSRLPVRLSGHTLEQEVFGVWRWCSRLRACSPWAKKNHQGMHCRYMCCFLSPSSENVNSVISMKTWNTRKSRAFPCPKIVSSHGWRCI